MTRRTRNWLIAIGCVVALLAGAMTAAAFVAYRAGTVVVRVKEKGPGGSDVAVRFPAILVPMAVTVVPDRDLRCAVDESRRWLPILRVALDVVSEAQDFVLVQVDADDERIRVSKARGRLVVDVASNEEIVHISVPLRIVDPVLKMLEGAAASL